MCVVCTHIVYIIRIRKKWFAQPPGQTVNLFARELCDSASEQTTKRWRWRGRYITSSTTSLSQSPRFGRSYSTVASSVVLTVRAKNFRYSLPSSPDTFPLSPTGPVYIPAVCLLARAVGRQAAVNGEEAGKFESIGQCVIRIHTQSVNIIMLSSFKNSKRDRVRGKRGAPETVGGGSEYNNMILFLLGDYTIIRCISAITV